MRLFDKITNYFPLVKWSIFEWKEFKDSKGVIRNRISKKNRQPNGKKKKYKRINNDLQHIHIKLCDRVTRTPVKTGAELRCSGRVSSSCSTSGTRRAGLVTNPVINREWGNDRGVLTTSETYPCHLWHRYSITANQVIMALHHETK